MLNPLATMTIKSNIGDLKRLISDPDPISDLDHVSYSDWILFRIRHDC
jgi:hypothetical protein